MIVYCLTINITPHCHTRDTDNWLGNAVKLMSNALSIHRGVNFTIA